MTVPHTPTHAFADRGAATDHFLNRRDVCMRAHVGRQAMVVTVSGDLDAASEDCVRDFTTRFLAARNQFVLDLRGIRFIGVCGISMLTDIDDACQTADVAWAMIGNRIISRVLRLAGCHASLPTARSISEALTTIEGNTPARRVLAPVAIEAIRW